MLIGNVFGRDANIEAQIERGMHLQRRFFTLQLMHGFFEQLDVHVEAHRADVAVLLAAQDIARAAQFQIERGDLESGAEVAEFLAARPGVCGRSRSARCRPGPADTHTPCDWTGPRGRAIDIARTNRSARRFQ